MRRNKYNSCTKFRYRFFYLLLFYKSTILNFYSNGKLLITSEYLVLDGAKSLALPTKFGQNLCIKISDTCNRILTWNSIDNNGTKWFSCKMNTLSFAVVSSSDKKIALTLQQILLEVKKVNPKFLQFDYNINVTTNLTFNKNWGLGTSSTLINNIANWGNINAFDLQFKIFGGSAYDIACAQNNHPILYQLDTKNPKAKKIDFNPLFKEQLYFVYLNKKQNSRNAIEKYKKYNTNAKKPITEISNITNQISIEKSLINFEKLLKEHENIIAKVIDMQPIQKTLFKDYFGQIKSLGAWGGDFILATGNKDTVHYFKNKGFETVIPYSKIIL